MVNRSSKDGCSQGSEIQHKKNRNVSPNRLVALMDCCLIAYIPVYQYFNLNWPPGSISFINIELNS